MIDRTSFDLQIAEHSATIARVNQSDWRHGQPAGRPIRAALASVLVALAARLAPPPRRGPAARHALDVNPAHTCARRPSGTYVRSLPWRDVPAHRPARAWYALSPGRWYPCWW